MKRLSCFIQGSIILTFCLTIVSSVWSSPQVKGVNLPQYFIENRGQADSQIRYYSPNGDFYFTPDGIFTHLIKRESVTGQDSSLIHEKHVVLKKHFLKANTSCEIVGENELPGKVNYFIGNDSTKWKTHLKTFKQVRYKNIYPGIDLVYHGNNGPTEYDLVISPEAPVSQIESVIEGADKLELSSDGDLLVHTPLGILKEKSPVSYQENAGLKQSVSSHFSLSAQNTLSFSVSQYDKSKILVIDPLIYSSFLGNGDTTDMFSSKVILDSDDNYYIAGVTMFNNFSVTPGAYDTTYSAGQDGFITKINSSGSALIFSTYLGGSSMDYISGVTLDTSRNIFMTGTSRSSNFPITPGAFDSTLNSQFDGDYIVVKLNATGSSLIYSTFIGGNNDDQAYGIAVDSTGCAYVAGFTLSTDFPLVSAFDTTCVNGEIGVCKLNNTGTALLYSSYLGGTSWDSVADLVLDAKNNAYITGVTSSTDFPITSGAADSTHNGNMDVYLAIIDSYGALSCASFIGGNSSDMGNAIALDSTGNIYIAGETMSNNFPTTSGVVDPTFDSYSDAFIAKFNPTGTQILYSTLLSGNNSETIYDMVVDSAGNAIVTGGTSSPNFLVSSYPIDNTHNGDFDVFVSKLNSNGTAILYSTYMGDTGRDVGTGITLDSHGNACITGYTLSPNFTITDNALESAFSHHFFAKLSLYDVPPNSQPDIFKLPDLKLFVGESVANIMDLEKYNDGLTGDSYQFLSNFMGLESLSGSTVSQNAYSSATVGSNTYVISNLYGACTVSNKVKYSTYKLRKLPVVALKPGQSETIDLSGYCYGDSGTTTPESFGNPDSIFESNPSLVTGNWNGSNKVVISSLGGFTSGQARIEVVASTVSTEPFDEDYDKEPVHVYPDLLNAGSFTSSTDLTNQFGVEGIAGLSLPTIGYLSTVTDIKGKELSGVISFGFVGNTQGVKLTPKIENMVSCDSDQWWTARVRVYSPNPGNSMEAQVYNFRGIIPGDSVVDLGANILFGVPTAWSWIDIPVYTTATGKGYPQIILKGGSGSGTIYLQSVQYFQGVPILFDGNRGNHDSKYPYRKPSTMSQLSSGWATGEMYGTETPTGLGFSIESSSLVLDYSGAATGNNQKGSKITAKKPEGGVFTSQTVPGYQAGMKMKVEKLSGSFNTYDAILLLACYGVQSEGGYDFWSPGGQLIASAQFGDISDGWHCLAAPVRNSWQQFQFVTKNSQSGKIKVHEVDFLRDMDDPYYGDGNYF